MTLAKVLVHVLFSIYLVDTNTVAAQGFSNILSRLYNTAVQNNRPIVLIIDKNNLRDEQKYVKPSNLVESSSEGEGDVQPVVYLIKSQVRPSPPSLPPPPSLTTPPPPPQKRLPPVHGLAALGGLGFGNLANLGLGGLGGHATLGGLLELPIYRPRGRYPPKVHKVPLKIFGRPTPSPIVKLLRQSECDASEACIDKCKQKFGGKKRMVCKAKCEVTYECVPAGDEDYDDPCEDDAMECGDKNPSTRGIVLVPPEKPPCTRC